MRPPMWVLILTGVYLATAVGVLVALWRAGRALQHQVPRAARPAQHTAIPGPLRGDHELAASELREHLARNRHIYGHHGRGSGRLR